MEHSECDQQFNSPPNTQWTEICEESDSKSPISAFNYRRELKMNSPLSSPLKAKKEQSFIQPCCVDGDDVVSDSSDDGLPYSYHHSAFMTRGNQEDEVPLEELEGIESFDSIPLVSYLYA